MSPRLKHLLQKANDLLAQNLYNQAEIVLNKALKIKKNEPEVYSLLGEVYCKQGRFKESIVALKKAEFLLPGHPKIIHLLGWATFMNGDAETGRKLLKQALEGLPQDISILCDLAVLENQEQNGHEAEKYALKAMEISPNDPMVQEVFVVVSSFNKIRSQIVENDN